MSNIRAAFRQNLERFVALEEAEFEHFYQCFKPHQVRKGTILLNEGQHCKQVYFLGTGCMKYFYLVDGIERIGQFFFEGTWVSDLYSFLSQTPSKMNLSTIEDSHLLSITHPQLQQCYEDIPKLERFGRLLIEYTFISSQQRSASFLTQTPTEKYLQLVRTRPKVIQRIPQYMIAAYLGIKPESLSRIRKKIAQKS